MDQLSIDPIPWQEDSSVLLLNPRLPQSLQENWQKVFAQISSGKKWIGVTTSGTGKEFPKIALLTRSALMASARAVTEHLAISSEDKWFHILPDFHVGGLGIWARSKVSGCQVYKPVNWQWDPHKFVNGLKKSCATWSSVVPTQVFDLVSNNLKAPAHLKALLVGGGAISNSLFHRAQELSWPLLLTYGMTECCSQIATATLKDLRGGAGIPRLRLLSHIQVRVGIQSLLQIKSPALFEGYLQANGFGLDGCKLEGFEFDFFDPKQDGWFQTSDRVNLTGDGFLQPMGRVDNQVKILGELVDLVPIQALVDNYFLAAQLGQEGVVVPLPDSRCGHRLVLIVEGRKKVSEQVKQVIDRVNRQLLPFERIQEFQFVAQFPRTELGKISTWQLLQITSRQLGSGSFGE